MRLLGAGPTWRGMRLGAGRGDALAAAVWSMRMPSQQRLGEHGPKCGVARAEPAWEPIELFVSSARSPSRGACATLGQ
eukprot:191937-Alexandrium_andersonii.AAC.1